VSAPGLSDIIPSLFSTNAEILNPRGGECPGIVPHTYEMSPD
jgi:hypothetical protein